jgi:fructose-bisphosphate aldolase, class II
MSLVNLSSVLVPAFNKGYGVGSFNVIDSRFVESVINAAENRKAPVIVSLAEVHFQYADIRSIASCTRLLAEESSVPIVLNLDHGLSFETVAKAVRYGFTSVMFDGSRLEYEENIRQTREIVKLCGAVGVSVEAELGAVGGAEAGDAGGTADPELFTDPVQAKDFVAKTGIDALAVAIGNVHGKYKGDPCLDFERLLEIKHLTGIPLVLHGGSGISDDDFRRAANSGIAKINFYTEMARTALVRTEEFIQGISNYYTSFDTMNQVISDTVREVVEERINVFGSSNKA